MSDSQCPYMCPYYVGGQATCVKAMQDPKREIDRAYIASCPIYIKLIK